MLARTINYCDRLQVSEGQRCSGRSAGRTAIIGNECKENMEAVSYNLYISGLKKMLDCKVNGVNFVKEV